MKAWVDFRLVKQAVSLESALRYYQVPMRRRGDQLEGSCPIHRGERKDSFRVSLSKNGFQCFACQASGNVLDFVAAMERCSIREAALRLQQWFDVAGSAASWLPDGTIVETGKGELIRKKETCNPALKFALTGIDPRHPYLMQRGIDVPTAAHFGVGFYAGPGLQSGRIVIPIRNARGAIVAYAGRALREEMPRYKLPAGFRKGLEIFNLDRAVATGSKTAMVVEGYFDCMRVHQSGLPWVVALMGCSLSVEQETALVEQFQRVILMLDGDAAGRAATHAIAARLHRKCEVASVGVPDGMQPDQLSPTAVRRLLEESTKGEEKSRSALDSYAAGQRRSNTGNETEDEGTILHPNPSAIFGS